MRRRTTVAALASVAVALAVFVWVIWNLDTHSTAGAAHNYLTDGPLVLPPAHGWARPVPVGQAFTDGFETLHLAPGATITLQSVELVGEDLDGLEIVGAKVAYLRPPAIPFQYVLRFPPPERQGRRIVDLQGAEITADSDGRTNAELLVGLHLTKASAVRRDGVRVVYTYDGETYQGEFPAELTVCAAGGPAEQECTAGP